MGYSRLRRLLAVELPIAVPVIAAGLRVAAVGNVSLVSVASPIGVPAARPAASPTASSGPTPRRIVVGIVLCVSLALVFDTVIVLVTRLLTPWRRAVHDVMNDIVDWLTDPAHWTGPERHPAPASSSTSVLRDRARHRRAHRAAARR